MTLSRALLEKVAKLARLRLSESEAEVLTRECDAILDYFEQVSGVDVASVEPSGALLGATPLREDVVGHDPLQRPLDEMAPAWRGGFFVIPRLPAMDADDLGDGGGSIASG